MKTINRFSGEFRFLSNFWMHTIEYEGIEYPSNEHAYSAAKTLNVSDRLLIAQAATPGAAKRLGRSVELREGWDTGERYSVMMKLLQLKFTDPQLAAGLKSTAGARLIEGNTWHDNVWGVCSCDTCPGVGHNFLGWLLMQLRTVLLQKEIGF